MNWRSFFPSANIFRGYANTFGRCNLLGAMFKFKRVSRSRLDSPFHLRICPKDTHLWSLKQVQGATALRGCRYRLPVPGSRGCHPHSGGRQTPKIVWLVLSLSWQRTDVFCIHYLDLVRHDLPARWLEQAHASGFARAGRGSLKVIPFSQVELDSLQKGLHSSRVGLKVVMEPYQYPFTTQFKLSLTFLRPINRIAGKQV